ncbi:hypothetical protein HHK36_024269 [Tetracentron sinense]|uniref:Pentatricopeptide repeat-containing protein n=1 Tax=Tetracentron sinense TaxID=13715 RepID=A0A834YKK4_TETSI|nr:hypothetical protein HHK36_024269 [Tetracentron sinense]
MVEVLRIPLAIHVASNGSHGQRHPSSRENRIWVQFLRCNFNFSSANGKMKRQHAIVDDLNMATMVEECGSWSRIQQPRISGTKWLLGSTGRNKNSFMIASFESGLVCKDEDDDDDDELIQERKEELGTTSYEQKSPPWRNLAMQEDSGSEPRGCSQPSSNSKGISYMHEHRLHFLEERDEEILSKRILSLSRSNKVRSALELYMSMVVSGLQPNLHACNSLLSCLLRNELLDDALIVFEMMKEKGMTTGHTYSLILKAIARAQSCDSALQMFVEIEGEGTLKKGFDAVVYNTMISVCGKANNWVETERIWRSLKENGHTGTRVTYCLLVSTFVRCGQTELALDAYHEMVQNGLKPGEDTMKAIIGACTKEGNWSLALIIFQNMLNVGLRPNTIAYNALINSLGKAGEVDLAFRVYDLMRSSGHRPDVYTWNALLKALYRGNRYADALQLFESIKSEQNAQLNLHLYNTALMSCQRLGLWERSLQLLWQMPASGLSISTESYNLVIGACESARKPKVALQVYEHMVHQKCTPDIFTHLSLIRACIWGSLWIEVEEILERVTPNVSLYNAVIHGMCLQGKITSAKKLYMRMRESGLKPDGKTRALMLQNLKKDSVRQNSRYPSRPRQSSGYSSRPCR